MIIDEIISHGDIDKNLFFTFLIAQFFIFLLIQLFSYLLIHLFIS